MHQLSTHLSSNRLDVILVICAATAAWAFPWTGANWFRRAEQWCVKLARRRRLAVLVVGLLALTARAALLPIQPIPQPRFHDEFSYLLAADTFAHGRVTNPTHPMWMHFESFHILQKPTTMSKLYPAQGIFLAAGQVLAGHPFWGVWFSTGLMCAAICWMLQAWMPPGWALLGALLAVIRLMTFSFGGSSDLASFSQWGNSYWGGSVAAIGGALVLGALPRMITKASGARCQVSAGSLTVRNVLQESGPRCQVSGQAPSIRDALLMGLGLATLANSRPYEGFLLALGVAVVMSVQLVRKKGPTLGAVVRRGVAPLLLVLLPTIGAMGYYFWRVTGSPFRVPYVVYQETYDPVPLLAWQSMKAVPEYRRAAMKEFYLQWELSQYRFAREHPAKLAAEKGGGIVGFFFGPLLLMPIAALLLARRGKFFRSLLKPGKARLLLLLCALPVVGMALPVYFQPHYAAPLTAALLALATMAMRQLRLWQWHRKPVGRQMVRAVPVLAVAILALHTIVLMGQRGLSASRRDFGRTRILAQLQGYSGGQLVIVQYTANHNVHNEWVYNDANIDAAKAVWAGDMGVSANEELIRYFKDRQAWLLEADDSPPKLLPYTPLSGRRRDGN